MGKLMNGIIDIVLCLGFWQHLLVSLHHALLAI